MRLGLVRTSNTYLPLLLFLARMWLAGFAAGALIHHDGGWGVEHVSFRMNFSNALISRQPCIMCWPVKSLNQEEMRDINAL